MLRSFHLTLTLALTPSSYPLDIPCLNLPVNICHVAFYFIHLLFLVDSLWSIHCKLGNMLRAVGSTPLGAVTKRMKVRLWLWDVSWVQTQGFSKAIREGDCAGHRKGLSLSVWGGEEGRGRFRNLFSVRSNLLCIALGHLDWATFAVIQEDGLCRTLPFLMMLRRAHEFSRNMNVFELLNSISNQWFCFYLQQINKKSSIKLEDGKMLSWEINRKPITTVNWNIKLFIIKESHPPGLILEPSKKVCKEKCENWPWNALNLFEFRISLMSEETILTVQAPIVGWR